MSGETIAEARCRGGLMVRVLPRPDLRHVCCVLSVNYGSVDSAFLPAGRARPVRVPAGIAHFLEHKMFEKERGDLMPEFARLGSSANAMTSHTKTSYFFTGTGEVRRGLELLLELVLDTHFTDELVRKEQGIIEQEIRGYDDQPGWQGYRAVMGGLFAKHPVREDIAGTVESIKEITPRVLELCHRSFYRPSNMVLCGAGPVSLDEMVELAERKLGAMPKAAPAVERILPEEPARIARRRASVAMPVSMPRLYLGFKGPVGALGPRAGARFETAAEMFLEAVLGETGETYDRLFGQGLITDDFSWSVTQDADVAYGIIGGQTPDPDALEREIGQVLEAAVREPRKLEADLERVRKRSLGDFIRSFDSPETSCWNLVETHFRKLDLFGFPALVQGLGPAQVVRLCRGFLHPASMTSVTILPRKP